MKIEEATLKNLIELSKKTDIYIQGRVLRHINLNEYEGQQKEYLEEAIRRNKKEASERFKVSQNAIKNNKELTERNLDIFKSQKELEKYKDKLEEKNIQLEKENDSARNFNLKMEELKANNKLKMNSLILVLTLVAILIFPLIFHTNVSDVVQQGILTLCTLLVGTFLVKLLTPESGISNSILDDRNNIKE